MALRPEEWKSNHLVVVAIDFGTTYSGYAFSFNSDPQKVKTNQSWAKQLISPKTPTVLLLTPERKFHSFGFDAQQKYSDLLEDDEAEGWSLFRRFKMSLYDNENVSAALEVEDLSNTVRMPAITIFSMAIKYLKDHAMSLLNSTRRSPGLAIRESDVYFVLTVPAIWDDRAKLFMRQAAAEAGISREHFGMALESEAASVWCQTIPLIIPSSEDQYAITTVGYKYMVVDLGGGTADIAVHQRLSNGKLRELVPSSGGHWGGTIVDKRFIGMIADVMGNETMGRFYRECLSDVFDLLKEFETAKRTISPTTTGMIKIRLPARLHEINMEENKKEMTQSKIRQQFSKTINSSTYADKISIKGDKLRVDADFARQMFSHSINKIVEHMQHLFELDEVANVNTILVVGGFSECSLVQDILWKHFPDKQLVFPPEPGLVVLKGAVLFGHKPSIMESRKAKFTYGIKMTEDFDAENHDKKHRIIVNGVEKCKNVFQVYVRKGSEIPPGYEVSEKHSPTQEDIRGGYTSFAMYISTDQYPKYVDEPTCKLLGSLEVRIPEDDNKAYETSFIFGDVEIVLVVKHLHSGKMFSKYFNI